MDKGCMEEWAELASQWELQSVCLKLKSVILDFK